MGVGLLFIVFVLGYCFVNCFYDLFLQVGVGGVIDCLLVLGSVVWVIFDCYVDIGVEEVNGSFISMYEMGFVFQDDFLFK